MNVLELIASSRFQQRVDEALTLSQQNEEREVGFSSWTDGDITLNRPAVGEAGLMHEHMQGEHTYPAGTGFHIGESGELLVMFHSHPEHSGQKRECLQPSVADVIMLAYAAALNQKLAELFGRETWTIPVGVIGAVNRSELSFFQVSSQVFGEQFNLDRYKALCQRAVWTMFERCFPQHASKNSGLVYECFANGLGYDWFPWPWLPRFLWTKTRLKSYFELVNVQWTIEERSKAATLEGAFETQPIPFPEDEDLDVALGMDEDLDLGSIM